GSCGCRASQGLPPGALGGSSGTKGPPSSPCALVWLSRKLSLPLGSVMVSGIGKYRHLSPSFCQAAMSAIEVLCGLPTFLPFASTTSTSGCSGSSKSCAYSSPPRPKQRMDQNDSVVSPVSSTFTSSGPGLRRSEYGAPKGMVTVAPAFTSKLAEWPR